MYKSSIVFFDVFKVAFSRGFSASALLSGGWLHAGPAVGESTNLPIRFGVAASFCTLLLEVGPAKEVAWL